jgi:DNA-binding CsgD family transcriptional regulator
MPRVSVPGNLDRPPGKPDVLTRAARAYADRSYEQAAELFRSALAKSDVADAPGVRAAVLLDLARSLDRAGSVCQAWRSCQEAADLARAVGDSRLLADAATTIRSAQDQMMAGQVHELCVEALASLDSSEQVRRGRVQAVMKATESPWARPAQPLTVDVEDAESRFRALQAMHAERLGAEYVHDRLEIADSAVSLGRRIGSGEYSAWGLVWRIDALAQLGDRIALEAELAVLDQVVDRLREPLWTVRLLRIRAMLKFADGRLDESRDLSDRALACCPDEPWEQFLHLVVAAHLAECSGEGLVEIEPLVRAAVEAAPFFARGWLAGILVALGRTQEASVLWRAIAPHVRELPRGALESFIAQAGNARLCVDLGDRDTASVVYQELLPLADLWVCARADSPWNGPVRLHLGRLALLLGDLDDATLQVTAALSMSESTHALPFVAESHLVLAEIAAARGALGDSAQHAEAAVREAQAARDQAQRFGLGPLAAKAQAVMDAHRPRKSDGLTDRETQIVVLLAGGLSNRAIAQRLQLSERTVENHVSHVLTKTGHSSRAGVAAWYTAL